MWGCQDSQQAALEAVKLERSPKEHMRHGSLSTGQGLRHVHGICPHCSAVKAHGSLLFTRLCTVPAQRTPGSYLITCRMNINMIPTL